MRERCNIKILRLILEMYTDVNDKKSITFIMTINTESTHLPTNVH